MIHRICRDCPWRLDAPLGVWSEERWRSLADSCRGDALFTFACHNSMKERPAICAGWARVEGPRAPGFRLSVLRGLLDPAGIDVTGVALYPSFDEMLRAHGIEDAPTGRLSIEDLEEREKARIQRLLGIAQEPR